MRLVVVERAYLAAARTDEQEHLLAVPRGALHFAELRDRKAGHVRHMPCASTTIDSSAMSARSSSGSLFAMMYVRLVDVPDPCRRHTRLVRAVVGQLAATNT